MEQEFIFLGKKRHFFESNLSNFFLLLHSQKVLQLRQQKQPYEKCSREKGVPEKSCFLKLPGEKTNLNSTTLLKTDFFTCLSR